MFSGFTRRFDTSLFRVRTSQQTRRASFGCFKIHRNGSKEETRSKGAPKTCPQTHAASFKDTLRWIEGKTRRPSRQETRKIQEGSLCLSCSEHLSPEPQKCFSRRALALDLGRFRSTRGPKRTESSRLLNMGGKGRGKTGHGKAWKKPSQEEEK